MGQSAALIVAATILLAAIPFGPAQESKEKPPAREPGPREPIAGLAGFDSLSKVRLASSPDVPRELKVTCSFPDRMRWMLSGQVEGSLVRELQYQHGDSVYRIPTGTGASEACEGESKAVILRRLHLRRALMLFPDGYEWKGEGESRTTSLGRLGSLRARVSAEPEGRPGAIDCFDAEGTATESCRAVTWRKLAGRSWPATLELWSGEERVWVETVESVDTSARFVDSFFLPPDRREGSTAQPVATGARTLDIPATCSLRTVVPAGSSWEAALSGFEGLRSSVSTRLAGEGLKLESIATFEVSDQGLPTASILRLTTTPEIPPQGFAKEAARRGLALAVEGFAGAGGNRIAELRRGVPKGSVARQPYVRFGLEGGTNRQVVLIVPFEPAR